MDGALNKFLILTGEATSTPTSTAQSAASSAPKLSLNSKLRPWLQDFDLGADYDAAMIRKQIQAVEDSLVPRGGLYAGWLLWDPKNLYTADALDSAVTQSP